MGIDDIKLLGKKFYQENCKDCEKVKNCKDLKKTRCKKFQDYMKNNMGKMLIQFYS